MKISIIGIGRVGSTLAYTMVLKGLCDELVLYNRNPSVALGDAYDLQHALPFLHRQMLIHSGGLDETSRSDIIAVCASVPMTRDMFSRMALLAGNVPLFHALIPALAKRSPDAKFVILSNPVDVLTYLTIQLSGFPPARVMGISTLMDSARYRAMLSAELSIHPDDLRAYILGEHGPNQFPALSVAEVGGEKIEDNAARRKMFDMAIQAGFDVLHFKGYTNYAVSLAAAYAIEGVALDTHRTMPLSVLIDGYLGITDVCLSIPVVVGASGVVRVLHPPLNEEETQALHQAAAAVRQGIQSAMQWRP